MPEENTPIVVGENFSIVFFEESRLVNQVLDMNIFKGKKLVYTCLRSAKGGCPPLMFSLPIKEAFYMILLLLFTTFI